MRKILLVGLLNLIALTANARQPQPAAFHIVVVEGDGVLNNIETHAGHELTVRVVDRDGNPVAGANVEFDAPAKGPGESFANGSPHFATATNANGVATASVANNNGTAGSFTTTVHVSYQGQASARRRFTRPMFPGKSRRSRTNCKATRKHKPAVWRSRQAWWESPRETSF